MKLIISFNESKGHFLNELDVVLVILELFPSNQHELLDFFVAVAEAGSLFVSEEVFFVIGAHVGTLDEEMILEFFLVNQLPNKAQPFICR